MIKTKKTLGILLCYDGFVLYFKEISCEMFSYWDYGLKSLLYVVANWKGDRIKIIKMINLIRLLQKVWQLYSNIEGPYWGK